MRPPSRRAPRQFLRRARPGGRRRPAASPRGTDRRDRSIDGCAAHGCREVRLPETPSAASSAGRTPRPFVVSSATRAPSPARSERICGLMSSVEVAPLRTRSSGNVSAPSRRSATAWTSVPSGAVNAQVTAQTVSCSDPRFTSEISPASTVKPTGKASLARSRRGSTSSPVRDSANSMSMYSATDSPPVGSASPKLKRGRGVNPVLVATGTAAMRIARSQSRAVSRCPVKRILPSLA